ncbi:MAG: hypothetical protein AAFQ94_27650 [Bacteroidota bacterium]
MKLRILLLTTLVVLAFSCQEEEVTPISDLEDQESVVWSDKFDLVLDPVVIDPIYFDSIDIVPITPVFPPVNDSLKNIYDVTITSGTEEISGILNINAGNSFSDNFVNGAVLTVNDEEFVLIDKNVAILNGYGTFRFTFEDTDGNTLTTTLTGILGRSLNGNYTTNSNALPSRGSIKALSQGDPFRIDFGDLDLSNIVITPAQ